MPFPETIFPQITYSRSKQHPILKISNFPANSGKVRYPNEKVPSAYITRQTERESAILVDPPRAKALGHQLRNVPLDFVSWISSAIFPWRERYRQIAPSPARVNVLCMLMPALPPGVVCLFAVAVYNLGRVVSNKIHGIGQEHSTAHLHTE